MPRSPRTLFATLASTVVAAGIFCAAPAPLRAQVNPDKGEQIVRLRCLGCHRQDLISQQRLGAPGWTREVDKMIRWGAAVEETEKPELVAYLAARFGIVARTGTPPAAAQNGKAIYESRCRNCHGSDLVDQQRLSRPGWVREVEKMMRWGAAVGDSEKDPLIDFLAAAHGPS